ncbi:hypothetical protein CPB86DRAFT_665200, partial [Serendipita vermifera]
YSLFCVLNDAERTSFSVNVEPSATVDELKRAVVEKGLNALTGIGAYNLLTLYRVDIQGPLQTRKSVVEKRIPGLNKDKALDPLKKLSSIYSSVPSEDTVHIIVQIPSSK